jgi:hypothetical protein
MNELLKAIYTRLTTSLTANVYDHVPHDLADSDYPFVRIDAINPDDNGTDTETGFISELQIIGYSRYRGFLELNDLTDEVYNALHRWAFPDTISYGISDIHETERRLVVAPDGLTRNSVQRYVIQFEPLPAP